MGTFKYLSDVISGRIKHLNETKNVVISDLWSKLEKIRAPNDFILKRFLVAVGWTADSLMGMHTAKVKRIVDIDPKEIDIEQFRQLYAVLLSYFVFLLYFTHPFLKDELKKSLLELTDRPEVARRILQSLDKIGKMDLLTIGTEVWRRIVGILDCGEEMDIVQISVFTELSFSAYKRAGDDIKSFFDKELNSTNEGMTYGEKEMHDEDIAEYKKAIDTDPNLAEVHHNLGVAYGEKGMHGEAIAEFKKAIKINPNLADTHHNLGIAYGEKGMHGEAIAQFVEAIRINPDYADAHYGLSAAYYYVGEYSLAIRHCDKAIELGYQVRPEFLDDLKPHRGK